MSDCPRCGARLVARQEYCLECGARLPGDPGLGRSRSGGVRWRLRTFAALLVALGGAAVAVAATSGGRESADILTATGGFATLPTTSTLPSPGEDGPAGIVEWPAGEEGWTIALASLPQTEGRRAAVARMRQARRRGLSPVGILDSSRYASLHPGYWVVFGGIYGSEAEATSSLQSARKVSRTATVRRVVP
jgi:hypothetical protein